MKMYICLLFTLIGLLPYGNLMAKLSEERVLHSVIDKSISRIEKKYKMHCCGTGLSMPGGPIRSIGFSFDAHGPVSREEVRKLLVGCAEQLIAQARNSCIDQFLFQPPFGIEQVQINLFFKNEKHQKPFHPDIGVATLCMGILRYQTYDPTQKYPRIVESISETYEEALTILTREGDTLQSEVLAESKKQSGSKTCRSEARKAQRKHRHAEHTL